MKKTFILLILIVILAILVSCTSSEKDDKFHSMNSKTFFESVTLPEKLSIKINLDDIKNIDNAKSYKVNYVNFDKQKLIDTFIKNKISEEKIWAEGPQIIASDNDIKETLNINDGGKSFFGVEKENGRKGFSYRKRVRDMLGNKLDIIANLKFIEPSYAEQKYGYNLNSDYSSYRDLDFLSYEDSLKDIKIILSSAGMPEFDVDEAYSLDLETIKAHYKLYLNNERVEVDKKNFNWVKDDESYIFLFQQLIDNIPVINKSWQMPDGTKASVWGNSMPATRINLVYDRKGISEISVYNILNILDEIKDNNLINIYEALNKLIEDYSLTILEDDISIVSAKLCYLIIPKNDSSIELIPGWVFCSTKIGNVEGSAVTEYKYDVIDAVTGKLYKDRW